MTLNFLHPRILTIVLFSACLIKGEQNYIRHRDLGTFIDPATVEFKNVADDTICDVANISSQPYARLHLNDVNEKHRYESYFLYFHSTEINSSQNEIPFIDTSINTSSDRCNNQLYYAIWCQVPESYLIDSWMHPAEKVENGKTRIMYHCSIDTTPAQSAWCGDFLDPALMFDLSSSPKLIGQAGAGFIPPHPPLNEFGDNPAEEMLVVPPGRYAGFTAWFSGRNYGHTLSEHLPNIAYFRSERPNAKFILHDSKIMRGIIHLIDKEFYDNVVWVKVNQIVKIDGKHSSLSVFQTESKHTMAGPHLFSYFHDWLKQSLPGVPEKRSIIWYTRASSTDVHGGRKMDFEHERVLLAILEQKMLQYNRNEEIIIFNGQDELGQTMSIENQFTLFRSATTVIGPHGTGLANMVWMDPDPISCADRPKVLEFIPSSYSKQVQSLYLGHHKKFGRGFPQIDYHTIFYTPQSTTRITYVDTHDFENALDSMWGGHSQY